MFQILHQHVWATSANPIEGVMSADFVFAKVSCILVQPNMFKVLCILVQVNMFKVSCILVQLNMFLVQVNMLKVSRILVQFTSKLVKIVKGNASFITSLSQGLRTI